MPLPWRSGSPKEGARLILVARTAGGLEEVDDRVRAAGGEATLVPQDLTKGEAIDELGGVLAQRFGRLDISRRQCRRA